MRKNQFINLLLIFFGFLILFTLKTVLFNYLTYFSLYFNYTENAQNILKIYADYIYKPLILNDTFETPLIFDISYKFTFEDILFKFFVCNIILLLLLKYRKQVLILTLKEYFIYFIAISMSLLFIIIYTKNNYSFFNIFKYYTNNEFTNIFQYFIFFVFLFSVLIIYPLIVFLIITDIKFSVYFKLSFLVVVTISLYFFCYSVWDFLYITIDHSKICETNWGFIYMLKAYNISFLDCMNSMNILDAQPKNNNVPCYYYKEMAKKYCLEASKTQETLSKMRCEEFTKLLNDGCRIIFAENKK